MKVRGLLAWRAGQARSLRSHLQEHLQLTIKSELALPLLDASEARTATGVGAANTEGDNGGTRGAFFQVDVTARTGTSPTLVVKVQYTLDGVNWHDLDATNATTASITATGRHIIKVYPGLTVAANGGANSPLPPVHRLAWTIGGTDPSFTFSTEVVYLP